MPKIPRKSAGALATLLLLTTACTSTISGHGSALSTPPSSGPSSSDSGQPTEPTQPLADFSDCTSLLNLDSVNFPGGRKAKLRFGCARVSVPLNYDDPNGRKITIQLIKVHDTDNAKPIGSLVVNPGGPGGSGVELAVGLAIQVSDRVLENYDIVGFDPRGVGLSTPIDCIGSKEKDILNAADPDVTTPAGRDEARTIAHDIATRCSQKYGADLAYFNTVETAHDIDQIRQAVGDDKLNYLGFSYGTELGSVYAHFFPTRVRVAVLDGAVNPLTDDLTSFSNQLKGFESAFDQFAAWCKQHSPCSSLGDARAVVDEIVSKSRLNPIPSSASGETRKATPANVLTGVLSALYSQAQWPTLAEALIGGRDGDAKGLFKLADRYTERLPGGGYTNIQDANAAIGCNDSEAGPSDQTISQTALSWSHQYPMFGAWGASSLFTCQQWQPKRFPPPKPTAATATKVLVIGNLHDPATPYRGAIDLAKTMGNAEVLTWDGEGHTSYLQGSDCIDKYVEDYLIDATLPPPDTTCPR